MCEQTGQEEILRFWEARDYFLVLGYANTASLEANLEICQRMKLPVLRRCTGGGTVLQGPGCLNYSLILQIERANSQPSIPATNEFVLKQHAAALTALLQAPVEVHPPVDLAIRALKFGGNAQRRRKNFLLF